MTQLQVAYQQLEETKRANQARESLTADEIAVKDREVAIKEAKLPYEVSKLIEDTGVSSATKDKLTQEAINLKADLDLIKARTDLTSAQKEVELEKAIHARRENWKDASGYRYVENLLDAITGGIGKGVSNLFK